MEGCDSASLKRVTVVFVSTKWNCKVSNLESYPNLRRHMYSKNANRYPRGPSLKSEHP